MSVYILYYATCLEAATMVLLSDRLLQPAIYYIYSFITRNAMIATCIMHARLHLRSCIHYVIGSIIYQPCRFILTSYKLGLNLVVIQALSIECVQFLKLYELYDVHITDCNSIKSATISFLCDIILQLVYMCNTLISYSQHLMLFLYSLSFNGLFTVCSGFYLLSQESQGKLWLQISCGGPLPSP